MSWDQADRISDRIVDVINDELKRPGGNHPVQIVAGQLLALCALATTMPRGIAPLPYVRVIQAAADCLKSMQEGIPQRGDLQ
jgi:hypothetical protein